MAHLEVGASADGLDGEPATPASPHLQLIPTSPSPLPSLQSYIQLKPSSAHGDHSHAKENREVRDTELVNQSSHPMTATTSTSSLTSLKGEDVSVSAPYGTRSRHRSGARPNYADELDVDIDLPVARTEAVSSKRSIPSESTSGFRAMNGTANGQTTKTPSSPNVTNASIESKKASPLSGGTSHVQKKKRKYERVNGAKAVADSHHLSKDTIPGTSQFFALPDGTPEPPPTKKRRNNDGNAANLSTHVAPSSAVAMSRKSSANQVTKSIGRETCLVTFEQSGGILKQGVLQADDGSTYAVNDHVYLICEPPGEPYYLCRIMEFRRVNMDDDQSPITSMLVNWFYRPKDIQRANNDMRYLYASMQSDESPITSLRGKCTIRHRSDIVDLEEYRKQRDTFWFNQLYDRYIQRPYEMIPCNAVINVPEKVKKVLDENWKFLVVEPARLKELTSAVKLCKRCNGYCAPNDSVDCGVCHNTYHMTCVRPPLAKKPSRGFAWSCGPCSRAQEKKLEQRHTAILPEPGTREDDLIEEEEDEAGAMVATSPPDRTSAELVIAESVLSVQMDIARANMWPWRYLGIHCRVEDVLQYDDRAIYPRASSRLGPRHQALNAPWYGHPVQLVKPLEIKKRFVKGAGSKKDAKLSKDTLAAIETDKTDRANRPKWIQDEPVGYVPRGEDVGDLASGATAQAVFIMPPESRSAFTPANASSGTIERIVDEYMMEARSYAKRCGFARNVFPGYRQAKELSQHEMLDIVPTNFLDEALRILSLHNFNAETALKQLCSTKTPKDFSDPDLTKEEMKKFEDGVSKYGSELRSVRKHVKTRPYGEIVRLYYSWKKSERGQEIWSQHGERRHTRKRTEVSWPDIADEEDDSAFDNDKAAVRKRKFQCKFCLTRSSRQWRRAPMVAPGATVPADPKSSLKDKANMLVVALCQRCAVLWRRYATRWEDPDEIARSFLQTGGRATRRKVEEEILRELVYANEITGVPTSTVSATAALSIGIRVTVVQIHDQPKKKPKSGQDKELTPALIDAEALLKKKDKEKPQTEQPPPRPPTPPIEPQPAKWRQLPCAVCREHNTNTDELVSCNSCKMTVHRRCYAISEQSNAVKWICDTCYNDKHNEISMDYKCVLCPVKDGRPDLLEPPKVSHKKKTDRDREKERLEKILAYDMLQNYHKRQTEKGRPLWPREAIKKTASNNWMHIVCAIWTPEIRFSDSEKMEAAEGMSLAISTAGRIDAICKLCRIVDGGCVLCHDCHATFHVACAHEAGYIFGFDITPVKASRKDMFPSVKLGQETGHMTAAIWCPEHVTEKSIRHKLDEMVPELGLNALQTFVRTFKQADRTLTGTARKANNFTQPVKIFPATSVAVAPGSRRTSMITNGGSGKTPLLPASCTEELTIGGRHREVMVEHHQCVTCNVEFSIRWRQFSGSRNGLQRSYHVLPGQVNGTNSNVILWQCHKCFTREKLEITATPQFSETKDEVQDPARQPDYFELTTPRTIPPPLLAPWSSNGSLHASSQHPPEDAGVEQAQQELRASNFTVTTQLGGSHRMSGSIFGRLDDAPIIGWNFFLTHVQDNLGYDVLRNAVLTENGLVVHNSGTLMTALARVIQAQQREVRWRIIDHSPERIYPAVQLQHTPNSYTPAAHNSRPLSNAPKPTTTYIGTTTRPSSSSSIIRPHVAMQPQPMQQLVQGLSLSAQHGSSRSVPYLPPTLSAQQSTSPISFINSSASPSKTMMQLTTSTLSREAQQQQSGVSISGASSSPNLKNLVH